MPCAGNSVEYTISICTVTVKATTITNRHDVQSVCREQCNIYARYMLCTITVMVATITASSTARCTYNYSAFAVNSVIICKCTMTVNVATITASGTARRTYLNI